MGYYAHFAELSSLYLQLCHWVDETIDSVPDGRRWGDRWAWYAPAPTQDKIICFYKSTTDKLQKEQPPEYDRLTVEVSNDFSTVSQLLDRVSLIKSKGPAERQKWIKDAVETREYFRYKALDFEKKTFK